MGKFFGGLLLAVGILVATLSGLCTLTVAGGMIAQSVGPQAPGGFDFSVLVLPLVFGGVPFAAGLGFMFAGVSLLRAPRPPPDTKTFD